VIIPTAAVAMSASRLILWANGDLIPRADWNLRLLDIAARRAVDHVDADPLQPAREFDRLVDVPTAVRPIRRGNPHEQQGRLGEGPAHRYDALAQESNAIVERTAVVVGAAIAKRRKKLMKEITVRRMNLDGAETGGIGARRSGRESLLQHLDAINAQFVRRRIVSGEWDCARPHWAPPAERLR
jgi:hypothetical protein